MKESFLPTQNIDTSSRPYLEVFDFFSLKFESIHFSSHRSKLVMSL